MKMGIYARFSHRGEKRRNAAESSVVDRIKTLLPSRDTTVGALTLSLTAVREIGDATNIGYLKGLAGLALLIIEVTEGVRTCKTEVQRLRKYIVELINVIINESTNQKEPHSPQVLYNIESLQDKLAKIHDKVKTMNKGSYLKRILSQADDNEQLIRFNQELKHALRIFDVQQNITIHHNLAQQDALSHRRQSSMMDSIKEYHATCMQTIQRTMSPDLCSSPTSMEPGSPLSPMSPFGSSRSPSLPLTIGSMDDGHLAYLPPFPKIFHGREHEVSKLVSTLSEPAPARIAILGPPGIGKSSLARAVLHHSSVASSYLNRRLLVDARDANNEVDLLAAVADGLKISWEPVHDVHQRIMAVLGDQTLRTLLILDNIDLSWKKAETRQEVENLLQMFASAPNMSLIVTLGGRERPLGPLWSRPFLPPLGPLNEEAARETFASIADTQPDDPYLDDLLRALGYHPTLVTQMANLAQFESSSSLLARWQNEQTSMLNPEISNRVFTPDWDLVSAQPARSDIFGRL
ncbi:hypothetical protein SISNIDRAFT_485152 [Sistotremastrum niveocremeum HHB9708]|uniref:AAA+ ATPase domain-containing protein n=1 Tax=Sistotremastrum niveocremeum HHB9708 TaxID=1314777 RepID=A0A164VKG8_9AGAM|nr:hypothetical protein SISNIDRAFT_485152 [Sistotremastrum niveocremeum HHB9708]